MIITISIIYLFVAAYEVLGCGCGFMKEVKAKNATAQSRSLSASI